MQLFGKFVLVVSIWALVQCSPFDNGKYKKKTYNIYDDGKYYRPLDEGKYVPTDEGKYVYIYQRGVYPFDGTYQHLGRGDSNDYIGYRIYAPRFPFVHSVIKSLISKYISPDILVVSEGLEGSENSHNNVQVDNEVAMKCKVIESDTKNETEVVKQMASVKKKSVFSVVCCFQMIPMGKHGSSASCVGSGHTIIAQDHSPMPGFVIFANNLYYTKEYQLRFPPLLNLKEGENLGTVYNFKGSKVISSGENSLTKKVKLEYEVFVRIVEDTE